MNGVEESTWILMDLLSQASDRALDKSMCGKFIELLGLKGRENCKKELADGFLYILDMCVHGSLASDMVVNLIHQEWKNLGGIIEPGNANCLWRNNV